MALSRVAGLANQEPIAHAFRMIPERLHSRIACDVVSLFDPVYIGLHGFKDTGDGRSYRDQAHVCYPPHIGRDAVVMVLPDLVSPEIVVHELGHVLHWQLGFRFCPEVAVSDYAETNQWERFAEAFTAWVVPGYGIRPIDDEARAFFNQLSRN